MNIDIGIIDYWKVTSIFTILYIGPIVNLIITKVKINQEKFNSKIRWLIKEVSNSTFHIFLVQMVYYKFYIVHKFVDLPFVIIINLPVCIIGGVIFYEVENKISSKLLKNF